MVVIDRLKSAIRRLLYKRLVPSKYREIIDDIEAAIALQRNDNSLNNDYWAQKLRQAAHIIDKGLQRYDSESGHSAAWYQRAQEALSHIEETIVPQDPSLVWAAQKIKEYEKLQSGEQPSRKRWTGFEMCHKEGLLEVIKTRRSIRLYSQKTIDIDVIKRIVEVVNWSPTSCNRQPAKVFVTNNPALVRSCLAACQGATGFSEFVPCFLCFCADLRSYWLPKEIDLSLIDISLGVQNCCLIAHTLGLSLTLLSWAQHSDDDERELRNLLGIPDYYKIVVNGALGYPEYEAPVPLRKPIESTLVLR
jgi:nitroreductase